MSEYLIYQAVCSRRTNMSVRLSLYWGIWETVDKWVPLSLLGPDNEVNSEGDQGKAHIAKWWCVQERLEPRLELKESKRPLVVQRTIDTILLILDSQAQALRNTTSESEAICECGRCEGDPIAWHQAEAMEATIALLRSSLDK